MKVYKITLVVLWMGFVGGLCDLIKMGLSLVALMKIKETTELLVGNDLFWNLLSQIRLESIGVVICAGFLLLYYSQSSGSKK